MSAADPKPWATLQARAALQGVVLCSTTDDREQPLYVASRAELCKSFSSLSEIERWLDRVTGGLDA